MNSTLLTLIVIAIAAYFIVRARRKQSAAATVVIVEHPTISLIQLGNKYDAEMAGDQAVYSQIYSQVTATTVSSLTELTGLIESGSADLVHLFIDINGEGDVQDATSQKVKFGFLMNRIIAKSARYIVIANGNDGTAYQNGQYSGNGANVVMTLSRKGAFFTAFLQKVFSQVSKGERLPMAWHNIMPQIPGVEHKDAPELFAAMGAGNVVLMGDR